MELGLFAPPSNVDADVLLMCMIMSESMAIEVQITHSLLQIYAQLATFTNLLNINRKFGDNVKILCHLQYRLCACKLPM